MTRYQISRWLFVTSVVVLPAACSAQASQPTPASTSTTSITTPTTRPAGTTIRSEPTGLLVLRDRDAFSERPTKLVSPDGTVVGDSPDLLSVPRWTGDGELVLGVGEVDVGTRHVWFDPSAGSIVAVPELLAYEDLLPVTVDGIDGRTDQSRYAMLSDEIDNSFVVDLESGTVTRLSIPILRFDTVAVGRDAVVTRGIDLRLHFVDLATGTTEPLGPDAVDFAAAAPDGRSFIFYDGAVRAFREWTRSGNEMVITPPRAQAAFYRTNGDIVIATAERVYARTPDGEETLYTPTADEFAVFASNPHGLLATERHGDGHRRVVWMSAATGSTVELDHSATEGHTLALVDDRWLLAADDDFGVISKVDLQTGVRTPLGHAATGRTLTGLTQSTGPWLELGLFSDRQEVWLINRDTARVDVIEGSHRIVPSPDGRFIAYEVREETERLVSVAPVTDPTDAHTVRAGILIAWLPG